MKEEHDARVRKLWDEFRKKRKKIKLIRKEKKELQEKSVRRIREQGGTSCKVFWSDLKKRIEE